MPSANRGGEDRGYLPIRDYGLIGDCHGSALVGRNGSIDWCCLGRFDADPVFCRILDDSRGGFFSIAPIGEFSSKRSYLADTNILETVFATTVGDLVVTDFMPVGRKPGSGTHNYVDLNAPNWLVRQIEARRGVVEVEVVYRPSVNFGRQRAQLHAQRDRILADGGPCLVHDVENFAVDHDTARARIKVTPGRSFVLIVSPRPVGAKKTREQIGRYREITSAFWQEWIAYCRYGGPYAAAVKRSLLAIKLLIYAPSGALAAAPTTSLPEQIGGSRNWDYRYCWLRDTVFALYALGITGYGGEARRFSEYLPRVCAATAPDLRIMYGIDGEIDLAEKTLDHLEGYEASRPVRIGNGAYMQRQIDVFGEVLDFAMLFDTLGGKFDKDGRALLAALADHVADHWREPEQGLWEMRGPPLHHVHGKVMSWVALDRAVRLLGDNDRWQRERERIASEVQMNGGVEQHGHLVQAYGQENVDASLLRAPMVAYPLDEKSMRDTVGAIERDLRSGDFVYRYRTDDGIEGGEGALLICSFWLVDAYLALGKHAEAQELFERLLEHANDLGLYSEEIDPVTGSFLGNFPQAYTHLALVNSAAHLRLYEQRGRAALKGSDADRARLMVHATLGWKAIWEAFRATWKVGRILPSRKSVLR